MPKWPGAGARYFFCALQFLMLCAPLSAVAQAPAEIAAAIKNTLVQCGEFRTAGFDFRNYRDPEGVVWPAGRQQDLYHYSDVRESGGMLTVVEWVGHLRDFQPYGSRVRAGGYIATLTTRLADIAPNPAVVELTGQGVTRGIWSVRLTCRTPGCFTVAQRPLFPADVTNHRIPLAQWHTAGLEERRQADVWNFEVCGSGISSQQKAQELQRQLQGLLK